MRVFLSKIKREKERTRMGCMNGLLKIAARHSPASLVNSLLYIVF